MPTILRVYSNYQSNKMVCRVIEMVIKQMYLLHRKPFVLQMLGSVASHLDNDEKALYGDANKVSLINRFWFSFCIVSSRIEKKAFIVLSI